MTLLTKDAILKAEDIKTKTVTIEEWGGDVMIKGMTAERHAIFEDLQRGQKKNDALAYYAASILINEDGSPLFDSVEDIKALNGKSNTALIKILTAGMELNGIGEEDFEEEAKKS
jgi:hypothetical protein